MWGEQSSGGSVGGNGGSMPPGGGVPVSSTSPNRIAVTATLSRDALGSRGWCESGRWVGSICGDEPARTQVWDASA